MLETSPVRFPFLRSRITAYLLAATVVLLAVAVWALPISPGTAAVFLLLAAAVALAMLFGSGAGLIAIAVAGVLFHQFSPASTVAAIIGFLVVGICAYSLERWIARSGRDQKLRLFVFQWRNGKHVNPKAAHSTNELGRLDGYHNGELYGWALDANDGKRPLKVTLYVDERPRAETLAVHYRPDVGSHCFYFDLTQIDMPNRMASVDVRWSSGRLLPNAPLAISLPGNSARRKEAVLFMHISKTAGTAFREALAENYRQSEIAYVYPDAPGMLCRNLNELPLEQRRGFGLVSGHFQYGIHNFFPQDYAYVTIVRDPVERIISEHRYLREKTNDKTEQSAAASLTAMLERGEHINLDNLLVRCFSGVNENDLPVGAIDKITYLRALENLQNGFCLVGHQESLETAYASLLERFDWKPRGGFERVNTTRVGTPEEYAAARKAIEHYNRWDLQLYAEILHLYPRP